MKERGMLFSAPMVRALLDGNKVQTRRLVSDLQQPKFKESKDFPDMAWGAIAQKHARWGFAVFGGTAEECAAALAESGCCPHGQVGDRIWVRETFCTVDDRDEGGELWYDYRATPRYSDIAPAGWHEEADPKNRALKWTPGIHMPRAASRILLEIISVRVERLNQISEADCWAEGIGAVDGMLDDLEIIRLAKSMGRCFEDAAPTFAALWESVYGAGSWAANPWCWALEFRRVAP